MAVVQHYDELGVTPAATTAEIRTSYLALARRYHPDGLADADNEERTVAAARMARINAAWTVLGDAARRSAYDAALDVPVASRATVRDVGDTWTPYQDEDETDPRLLDDTPSGAPTLRRELTFLPAGLAAAAIASLVFGFAVGFAPLLGVGLILLVCSGLAFLVIPLLALAKSSRADRL